MCENVINRIERDKYGNVIKRITRYNGYNEERTYIYNEFNDLVEYLTIADNNGIITESKMNYVYEYDRNNNKVKMTQTFKNFGRDVNQSSIYYLNEYDTSQRLKVVTMMNEDSKIQSIEKYYYKGKLVVRKEECKHNFDKAQKISYYQYTQDNILYEKKCCLEDGYLSYYTKYKLLSDGRYSKQLISPIRGIHKWLVDDVDNTMCSFYMKEETLKPVMIKEVCDYAIANYPVIKFIRIDICESEDITFREEIEKVENYYKRNFDLTIIHDF